MVKKAMVFGVFDGLHEGHVFFLTEALSRTHTLVVIVPPDAEVTRLKGHAPLHPFHERIATLRAWNPTLEIVEGDARRGTWKVLEEHAPEKVFLGYDQQAIAKELEKGNVPFEYIAPHEPLRFKSSALNR